MDIKSVLVDKWDRIMVSYTIILAFLLFILKFYSLEIDYMMPLVLLVLAPIPWAIGKVQHQTEKLESSTIELSKLIDYPDMNKLLKPFSEYQKEINEKICSSDRICLLSRTGQHWWLYNLKGRIKDQNIRLLVLDPRDGNDSAFRMHFTSKIEIDEKEIDNDDIKTERKNAIRFLNKMARNDKVLPRVLNYLPAWSILILEKISKNGNPGNEGSIIYCELAPYKLTSGNRPVFKITQKDHAKCFKFFHEDFERLWERAKDDSWTLIEIK